MTEFPRSVALGAATAAYQIEGAVREDGRGESIWDTFCRVEGAVARGETGDVACDHYHRWREDLDLMASLGLEDYRFSIAWPRVQPDGSGALNRAGVDFYRRLAEGLQERDIVPVATLYHWDLPQALQDAGGWAERDTAERFAEYAEHMARELGDVVGTWITHNEPWVVSFLGHAEGVKAPGLCDWAVALRVSHHLLLSHGLALERMRVAAGEDARIGITFNLTSSRPASGAAEHVSAARRFDGHMNRWFLDPVLRGSYPSDMVERYERRVGPLDAIRDGDLEVISRPIDFLGVNYYFPAQVAADLGHGVLDLRTVTGDGPHTAMGWDVDAGGLLELLRRLKADYGDVPIAITENGAAYPDPDPSEGVVEDPRRVDYLRHHLRAVVQAVTEGVDVRAYMAWSLMDNFEWEHGYDMRFGLVHVDYETQARTVKRSGLWYRDLIASRRLDD